MSAGLLAGVVSRVQVGMHQAVASDGAPREVLPQNCALRFTCTLTKVCFCIELLNGQGQRSEALVLIVTPGRKFG